jgi:hypothetical protein
MDRKPRAFIVVGPESSGTRFVSRLFIDGGCDGSDEHIQPFDADIPVAIDTDVVWRRSVPHDGVYPNIEDMCAQVAIRGYDPVVVVIYRNWACNAHSQVLRGHATNYSHAIERIRLAWNHIMRCVQDIPYSIVSYFFITEYPEIALTWLVREYGLRRIPSTAVHRGDSKHIEKMRTERGE